MCFISVALILTKLLIFKFYINLYYKTLCNFSLILILILTFEILILVSCIYIAIFLYWKSILDLCYVECSRIQYILKFTTRSMQIII